MWADKTVLVTGGASFIGSRLVDSLVRRKAVVRVADDFSSGRIENLEYRFRKKGRNFWSSENLSVHRGDLKDRSFARSVIKDADIIFHLAASHGGRGYVNTHPAECCANMALDQLVFDEARRASVQRVCYASSACVYPLHLQREAGSSYLLKEEDADPFAREKANADLEYGWAKLMGEMALRAYHREYGMKASVARIFTAYGPRENETHAVMALIAKAFVMMDPYVIWGTGKQDRNFTYVQDIADGMILLAEKVADASPINLGRSDRITVDQAAELVFEIVGWKPSAIQHDLSMPEGVASRAADLTTVRRVLGWEPKVSFSEGFQKSIAWYFENKNRQQVRRDLERILMEH